MRCPKCERDWPEKGWTPQRPAYDNGEWRTAQNCRRCSTMVLLPRADSPQGRILPAT